MRNIIAIDLGGTKTEIMLTTEDPLDVIERKRVPTRKDMGYEFIIRQLSDLIRAYLELSDGKPAIGIGIPGSIQPGTGVVVEASTTCLIGKDVKKDLEEILNLPVNLENDANCFSLSEAVFGAGAGYEKVIGIILGTGMGGGIIINGKIWQGLHGICGGFGHVTIDHNGPMCWCGQRGCLELYISGTGAAENYFKLTGKKKSLKEIYKEYLAGGSMQAKKVIDQLLYFFGIGMKNIITSFDPDVIVIGGGVSNIPELYTKGVAQIKSNMFIQKLRTPVIKNKLGDSSGIFGAALIAGL